MYLPAPCSACSRGIRHDLCTGPPCPCLQCHTARIEAAAMAHLDLPPGRPGREALLADDLAGLLSVQVQRRKRTAVRLSRPIPGRPCACGRVVDGKPCMVPTGAAGNRARRYASHACIMYAYRRRQMIAKRAAQMMEAAGQAPYGWAEHWTQTGQDSPPPTG
jgi:hypothetical protein